jgi:hypothetical protein
MMAEVGGPRPAHALENSPAKRLLKNYPGNDLRVENRWKSGRRRTRGSSADVLGKPSLTMPKLLQRPNDLDQSALPAPPPLPPNASAGKRWRFRRNLVIYVAHRHGLSQRLLADVFDLPRSRIAAIIQELRVHEAGPGELIGS